MNSNLAEVSKPAQWKPGQSGNPAGKPPGTRTAAGAAASCRPYRATGYLAAERRCAISTTTRASGISIRTVWPSHKMRDQIICLKSGYDIQQL
jgi:hypothetical protein